MADSLIDHHHKGKKNEIHHVNITDTKSKPAEPGLSVPDTWADCIKK